MTKPVAVLYREDVQGERLQAYVESLQAAGARAVPRYAGPDTGFDLDRFAGIVLTGGVDVDPAVYGAERHAKVRSVDPLRDEFELRATRAALERDLPVLGVCRGHQLLNVAFGGTLLQHIEDYSHTTLKGTFDSSWHEARLAPGSRLAAIYGVERLRVNSRHHQAVTAETLAPGLLVAATTDDGVIEGVEAPGHRFVVGVQWHPEREELAEQSAPLFRAFVQAAREV